jgi:hypothetical protein
MSFIKRVTKRVAEEVEAYNHNGGKALTWNERRTEIQSIKYIVKKILKKEIKKDKLQGEINV